MAYEIAVMFGSVSLMFFMIYFAFRLVDSSSEVTATHQALSILLGLSGIVMGWIVASLSIEIASDLGASAGVIKVLSTAYWFWIIIGGLTMAYFVIYLISSPFIIANRKRRFELDE